MITRIKTRVNNRPLKLRFLTALLIGLFAISMVTTAWAHETITIGDYAVEFGWVNEPPIVGQPNALVINISPKDSSSSNTNVNITGVKIQVLYGGQTKVLALQPLGENAPGQFIAPMTPMRPGKYTFHLSGNIGTTTFNNDVVPEEVQTADVVQFPAVDSMQASTTSRAFTDITLWLGIAGVILGALGTILGVIALTHQPAK